MICSQINLPSALGGKTLQRRDNGPASTANTTTKGKRFVLSNYQRALLKQPARHRGAKGSMNGPMNEAMNDQKIKYMARTAAPLG